MPCSKLQLTAFVALAIRWSRTPGLAHVGCLHRGRHRRRRLEMAPESGWESVWDSELQGSYFQCEKCHCEAKVRVGVGNRV